MTGAVGARGRWAGSGVGDGNSRGGAVTGWWLPSSARRHSPRAWDARRAVVGLGVEVDRPCASDRALLASRRGSASTWVLGVRRRRRRRRPPPCVAPVLPLSSPAPACTRVLRLECPCSVPQEELRCGCGFVLQPACWQGWTDLLSVLTVPSLATPPTSRPTLPPIVCASPTLKPYESFPSGIGRVCG